jgi:hypothetical protein
MASIGMPVAVSLHLSSTSRVPLEARVLSEFHEMPGLSLTVDQAARLFGISQDRCAELLKDLADRGLLQRRGAIYGMCSRP